MAALDVHVAGLNRSQRDLWQSLFIRCNSNAWLFTYVKNSALQKSLSDKGYVSIGSGSTADIQGRRRKLHRNVIGDNFENLEQVRDAMQKQGLVSCNLIFGIDYTLSNMIQGEKTFGSRNLHTISDGCWNPYQKVICILGETLGTFSTDGVIPTYGFGDSKSMDKSIFELKPGEKIKGFANVLKAYNEVTPTIELGNPTNFAPLIYSAIEVVKYTRKYHILVIVADGQMAEEKPTRNAIIEASSYPLSIIVVGVGDGPWDSMNIFDNELPERKFDNFQFVDFHKVITNAMNPEAAFALNALMEIPDQYVYLKRNELIP